MTDLMVGVMIHAPVTKDRLTEPQKQAVHTILHVFPGAALLVKDGKEVPLATTYRKGCKWCEK